MNITKTKEYFDNTKWFRENQFILLNINNNLSENAWEI